MGPSFTGKAAQNRGCGDHHTRAERAAGFSPHPEYYAIPRHQTIGAKAIRRLTIASVLHNLD
jgi:hypothetical protein